MAQTVVLQVPRPIKAVRAVNSSMAAALQSTIADEHTLSQELKIQNQKLASTLAALGAAAAKVNKFYDQAISVHNAEIAKLAVEITRKILAQEIEERHYQIEHIIADALKDGAAYKNITVHLHPDDEQVCRKMQSQKPELFADYKLVSDAKLKRADCRIEFPDGVVECFIESKLSKVTDALVNHHE